MVEALMEVTIQHLGDVKFEASTRGHRVICDQPPDNGGSDTGMTPPEYLLVSGDLRRVLRRSIYEGQVSGTPEPRSESQRGRGHATCATRTVSDRGHRSRTGSATSGRCPAGSQGVSDPQHLAPRARNRDRGDHAR